jgi:hypothetical protein
MAEGVTIAKVPLDDAQARVDGASDQGAREGWAHRDRWRDRRTAMQPGIRNQWGEVMRPHMRTDEEREIGNDAYPFLSSLVKTAAADSISESVKPFPSTLLPLQGLVRLTL